MKQVQTAVGKLGFDPGPVDGIYGPQTVRAVAAFQEANGLANDGIVGTDTAAKMNAALASSKQRLSPLGPSSAAGTGPPRGPGSRTPGCAAARRASSSPRRVLDQRP